MSRRSAYALLILAVMAIGVLFWVLYRPGKVDAPKIFLAAQTYTRQLKANNMAIPPTVTLQELIDKKLLDPSDVSGFKGADVTISLLLNESDPQAVLMRVRFADGQEIVTLADGSVRSNR